MFDTAVQAISTILATLVGALFTVMVFRGGKRSEAAREQLDKVYAPAFQLVEPALYQKVTREECDSLISRLEEIVLSGGVLADPELIILIERYGTSPDGDIGDYPQFKYKFFDPTPCYLTNWYKVCDHIDKSYDMLCKKSFLPIRHISYRLNKDQYINGVIYALNFLKLEWPSLLFFAIIFTSLLLSALT